MPHRRGPGTFKGQACLGLSSARPNLNMQNPPVPVGPSTIEKRRCSITRETAERSQGDAPPAASSMPGQAAQNPYGWSVSVSPRRPDSSRPRTSSAARIRGGAARGGDGRINVTNRRLAPAWRNASFFPGYLKNGRDPSESQPPLHAGASRRQRACGWSVERIAASPRIFRARLSDQQSPRESGAAQARGGNGREQRHHRRLAPAWRTTLRSFRATPFRIPPASPRRGKPASESLRLVGQRIAAPPRILRARLSDQQRRENPGRRGSRRSWKKQRHNRRLAPAWRNALFFTGYLKYGRDPSEFKLPLHAGASRRRRACGWSTSVSPRRPGFSQSRFFGPAA